jgi:hypothetical protein
LDGLDPERVKSSLDKLASLIYKYGNPLLMSWIKKDGNYLKGLDLENISLPG